MEGGKEERERKKKFLKEQHFKLSLSLPSMVEGLRDLRA
jgi:hypothetical protein